MIQRIADRLNNKEIGDPKNVCRNADRHAITLRMIFEINFVINLRIRFISINLVCR